jgi:transcriptional regulator with XRE-family HTH domain
MAIIGRKRGQKLKPTEIDKLIGLKIKIMRITQGKKQRELAEYLDISLQQFQKYEGGKSKMTVSTLIDVVEYFDVPFEYFIPNKQEESAISLVQK